MSQPTGCLSLAVLLSLLLAFLTLAPVQQDGGNSPDLPQAAAVEVPTTVQPPGFEPVAANTDWMPVVQKFDGVEMALVPAGCFWMGSENGGENEQPVHRQCFNEPFWIDRYEVTWAMYEDCVTAGECALHADCTPNPWSSRDTQPINCETWFEARSYCEWRGTRLPTEAEWEYAARGPDGLVYPWGNDFVEDNVVYEGNSGGTAEVGSRPGGVSWVGAYDMSGNVWEWVSTISAPYPYDPDDGRENDYDTHSLRVIRGGSFEIYDDLPRAAVRDAFDPDYGYYNIGFRCVRSFD
jgi:formylglycine-generating enzyme required for sulfatase activity